MTEFMESITYWYWLAFGMALMLVEILVPGVLFLWLGIAAFLTGLALLTIPDTGWEIQLVLFAILSMVSVFAGRRFVSSRQQPTDHPTLNRRGQNLVGNRYTLDEATSNGRGRVTVGDGVWTISVRPQGADLSAGARVTVTAVDGATLIVEAAEG